MKKEIAVEDVFGGESPPGMQDVRRWIGEAKVEGAVTERARLCEKVEAWATETEVSANHAINLGRPHDADRLYGAVEAYARLLALLAEREGAL